MTWSGLITAAARNDADLFIFSGGAMDSPIPDEDQATHLYSLVGPENVDGVLVNSDLLGHFAGPERMKVFVESFAPLPRVKFEDPTPDVPTLMVDFYQGMYGVISHLIDVHGCRRIAFIKGSEKSLSGLRRYEGYCDALLDHHIQLADNLVVPGGMWPPAGQEGVRLLIDGRRLRPGVDIDALVVVNEFVALDALMSLKQRGIRVPQDIRFAAFDNMQEAVSVTPPLTTANLPVYEMGTWSVETLLALLRGEEVPPITIIPARLVVRQSCGCTNPLYANRVPFLETESSADIDCTSITEEWSKQYVMGEDLPNALTIPAALWHKVTSGLCHALQEQNPELFLSAVENGVTAEAHDPRKLEIWHHLFSQLRHKVLPQLGTALQRARFEEMMQQAYALAGEISVRAQETQKSQSRLIYQKMAEVSQVLATAQSISELCDLLATHLPVLGIPSAYISLFDDPDNIKGTARLIVAYDKRGRIAVDPGGWSFPAVELFPERLHPVDRQTVMVVEPLYHRQEQQGLAVFEVGPAEGALYDVLRGQISSAIKNIVLYVEAIKTRQEAEEANRMKTHFLTTVGHELRTPISLIVSLSEMVLREDKKTRQSLPENFRREMEVVHATGQHLDRLLRDVLDLGRSQLGKLELNWQLVDLFDMVQEISLVGRSLAIEKGLEWQLVSPPSLPKLLGDRTRLQQVLLNLISNACKFTNQGKVSLTIELLPGFVRFSVLDTGLGVSMNEQASIFDEFSQSQRTTARGYGGMGLGLAITRRLVELHGGSIGLQSSGNEGEGACFYFTLPLHPAEADGTIVASSQPDISNTVLVLTDRMESIQSLVTHLQDRGFLVMDAQGDDTLNWLVQTGAVQPGALLVDSQAGSEWVMRLIEKLKYYNDTINIPIIFFSLSPDDQGALLEMNTLPKSFAENSLSKALENFKLPLAGATKGHPVILIADDFPEILKLMARQLREMIPGVNILKASNGRQALALMEKDHPDLVLLDLLMPELDGFGVLEIMRSNESLRDIPVIILTAQSLTEEMLNRFARGVTSVMSKGLFRTDELFAQVEHALAHHKRLGSEAQRIARRAMAYIHKNYADEITRAKVAAYIGVNERYLTRCFHAEIGITPMEYLARFRIQRAREFLDEGKNVTETALGVGFSSSTYFSRVFRQQAGMSPSEYIRRFR